MSKRKSSIKFSKVAGKSFLQINVYKVVEQLLGDFLLCAQSVVWRGWGHGAA